jgi:hypothetical protein
LSIGSASRFNGLMEISKAVKTAKQGSATTAPG